MTRESSPAFASVVLDVDSTLCGLEGIDWLARRRGPELARRIAEVTDDAMRGLIELDAIYGERLALVAPTAAEMEMLGKAYVEALAPGARETVRAMRAAGVRVALVSGGLRDAVLPLARELGVSPHDVHTNSIRFDADGAYAGFDPSPLTTSEGKREVVASLALPRPILAVGDGSTDLAMRPAVDRFVAFTGFVRRGVVAAAADAEIQGFDELARMVLP